MAISREASESVHLSTIHSDEFFIPHSPKQIPCLISSTSTEAKTTIPSLIFTHGAGGTLHSDAIANFTHGFATSLPILCFQGNLNLKSRVKMFDAVTLQQDSCRALGGRSMGARAAVMAAKENTTHLVLVSYPLQSGKDVRDQILHDISEHVKVIFVTGDRDSMCDLDRLELVRRKMKCRTWRIVVQDADHGMNTWPKAGTESVGRETGNMVARWIEDPEEGKREGKIWWDGEVAVWSGWGEENQDHDGTRRKVEKLDDEKKEVIPQVDQSPKARKDDTKTKGLPNTDEAVSSRTRKRRKIQQ